MVSVPSVRIPAGPAGAIERPPASLVHLRALEPGDIVLGVAPDGTEQQFLVITVTADDGPCRADRVELRDGELICAVATGAYDAASGSFAGTTVVTAAPA